jgi:hypothetical protein
MPRRPLLRLSGHVYRIEGGSRPDHQSPPPEALRPPAQPIQTGYTPSFASNRARAASATHTRYKRLPHPVSGVLTALTNHPIGNMCRAIVRRQPGSLVCLDWLGADGLYDFSAYVQTQMAIRPSQWHRLEITDKSTQFEPGNVEWRAPAAKRYEVETLAEALYEHWSAEGGRASLPEDEESPEDEGGSQRVTPDLPWFVTTIFLKTMRANSRRQSARPRWGGVNTNDIMDEFFRGWH